MPISMYSVTVPVFIQHLNALSGILDKAAAHAEAKKVDPSVLLGMRLYPDMYSMGRQVQEATRHAARVTSALASVDAPDLPNTETTIPELKARIAKTVAFLQGLKPAQIDGSDGKEIKLKFSSGERTYTGLSLLLGHSLPNFYFHCTTAYDILRHAGVELVKRDFIGTPAKA
ncbi:MAG: DUF1993 domain-containing protein [Xanthobacteraceae bacterium]